MTSVDDEWEITTTAVASSDLNNHDAGVISIPITSPTETNVQINWTKLPQGENGENAIWYEITAADPIITYDPNTGEYSS